VGVTLSRVAGRRRSKCRAPRAATDGSSAHPMDRSQPAPLLTACQTTAADGSVSRVQRAACFSAREEGHRVGLALNGLVFSPGSHTRRCWKSPLCPAGPHSALTIYVPGAEQYNLRSTTLLMPTELTGQNG